MLAYRNSLSDYRFNHNGVTMSEILQDAIDSIEAIPPSDIEAISRIRQAIAERALYFADEDLDLTRRESDTVRTNIYERYNTRERLEQAMTAWGKAYEGFDGNFSSYSGRPLSKPPTLEDFAAHHVSLAQLEANYHAVQRFGCEAHLVLAPVIPWKKWQFIFNVNSHENFVLDDGMTEPDTEMLPAWAENHNTITHNGQLWTLTISSFGREIGEESHASPFPEFTELLALLALRDQTISMPQLAIAPDAQRNEYGDVMLHESGSLKTIVVSYNDKKIFELWEEVVTLSKNSEGESDKLATTAEGK